MPLWIRLILLAVSASVAIALVVFSDSSVIALVILAISILTGRYAPEIASWFFKLWSSVTPKGFGVRAQNRLYDDKPVGIYISPFISNFILRPVLSALASSLIVMSLFGLSVVLNTTSFSPQIMLSLGVLLTLFFALNDDKPIKVPTVHVAIMTFFGFRFDVYLTEGNHYWYGGKIGLNRSTEGLPNSDQPEEGNGFVYMGDRVIEIWGRTNREDNNLTLENVASDMSIVRGKLAVTVHTLWPRRWANSSDPILDIAERSRSAFRTVSSFFTGFDNAALKSIYSKLMSGHKIITAMTKRAVPPHPRGSVIQERSGARIFETLAPAWERRETVDDMDIEEELFAKLVDRINADADRSMRQAILNDNREIQIRKYEVEDHMVNVMLEIGAYFKRASVSDITLSDIVTEEANKAASENQQRIAQLLSAKTVLNARKTMQKGLDEPHAKEAFAAALATDGHAQFFHITGDSNPLTQAAIAGAKQIGGK